MGQTSGDESCEGQTSEGNLDGSNDEPECEGIGEGIGFTWQHGPRISGDSHQRSSIRLWLEAVRLLPAAVRPCFKPWHCHGFLKVFRDVERLPAMVAHGHLSLLIAKFPAASNSF
jgi:hypothetical protein